MGRAGADERRLLDRLAERERGVVVEEPRVEIRVAERDDVAQCGPLTGIQPQPEPVGVLHLTLAVDRRG